MKTVFSSIVQKKPTPYSNSKALVQDYLHSGLVLHVNCAFFSAIYSKSCLGNIYQQTLQYLLKYVEWLFVGWRLYKLPIFPGRPTSFGGKSLRKKTPLGADGWKLLSVIIHERPQDFHQIQSRKRCSMVVRGIRSCVLQVLCRTRAKKMLFAQLEKLTVSLKISCRGAHSQLSRQRPRQRQKAHRFSEKLFPGLPLWPPNIALSS